MIPIRINKVAEFKTDHQNAIMDYMGAPSRRRKLAAIDTWLKRNAIIKQTFVEILVAPPADLRNMAKQLESIPKELPASIRSLRELYEKFASEKKTPFKIGSNKYGAYSFVRRTGVTVCPYCNRNYVINVPNAKKRTSQLDHIWGKDKYPLLALSLFNLVPSCGPCNHSKGATPGNYYNPYDGSVKNLPSFHVTLLGSNFFENLDHLRIDLKYPPGFTSQIENMYIDRLYIEHRDLVQELLKKKRIYNHVYSQQLVKQLSKLKVPGGLLLRDTTDFVNLFLGTFISPDEFHKRPFAKLTSDIWGQIFKNSKI
ncbi:HNH endonuclease [Chitinophaga ginsengisoli]|uniref:HNH endonuclease n=1 Tax=Chitinophaga ginsengisoli TaxID=363837 RepID=A0A2P8FXK3_9BACT|nr:hypothetical protein [Chitinophaga ginsengisoli]PSL26453.1 hypothetical protein CLV42_111167 [Chitinophaga ginsengisoli]